MISLEPKFKNKMEPEFENKIVTIALRPNNSHLTYCCKLTGAITAAFTAICWLYNNKDAFINGANTIIKGANTASDIKNCMDNKAKYQNCLNTITYLQYNISGMKNLNISNIPQTYELLEDLAADVRDSKIARQFFTDLNSKSREVWDRSHPDVKHEMEKRVFPLDLSLQDIPKSFGAIAQLVHETISCNEGLLICCTEREELKTKLDKTWNNLDNCRVSSQAEINPLKERKGECKDLEIIKAEKKELQIQKDACKEEKSDLKTANVILQEKIDALKKERDDFKAKYEGSQEWFFTNWFK